MAGRFEKQGNKRFPILAAAVLLVTAALAACMPGKAPEEQAELRLGEETLVRVTEPQKLREMTLLLSGAKDLGYVPKTFLLGPELVYTGTDGRTTVLELDLDSDLFRYDGRFFDYGPGNDNNAMPELLGLLGLEDWPEEVKAAYPEWFASVQEDVVPTVGNYRQQAVYMDLWYPDWSYVKIQEEDALVILDALRQEAPAETELEKVPVEESIFTVHIAYDDGREYDLAYIGEDTFLLWEGGKDTVYSFTGAAFRETLEERIALSKALSE